MAVKIADGHNNIIGLQYLNEIDPPKLEEYGACEAVYTVWSDYQERLLSGDRRPVQIGLPSVTWELGVIDRNDLSAFFIFTDFVTIQTLDKQNNAYKVYNATILPPVVRETTYDRDTGIWWEEVVIEFIDLIEIPVP